ncbi:lysophospholipid acyltransferase family protein [Desulfoluna spongiiphila]|uniref:1-acyl-sn-glycerol-3-phosphate acyltransferase n=1 Tax=Desulfoluna spongiiphila TaxID=419481 RepID=A0A1G5IB96_9BACT|nr:lysophospholipid acyltransferase family protein [Desulfoluna spongiiphila]SCY72879.1 1-acyl-sn-glycerol-3-phosphate acyltransferase [Desulfoluna spongiiphila]VVS93157.1 1-acyl-sn-glycerol-3-phosphate acyltransferase [Desulfoluna spongiiphila]
MLNRLISTLFLAYIGITCVFFYLGAVLIWLVTRLFDKRLVVLHLYSCFWASVYIWTMPAWRIATKGRHKVDWKKTYMVVSNHQSQLDILAAFTLFFPFKWVSKAEIFKVPFVGWNMVMNRYIRLKRGDKESIAEMMDVCEKTLKQGASVYFFPEGTRSFDGHLRPFKPGAFILAHDLKLPILPIAINGTRKALPKHSMNFHGKHHLDIEILDEIPYEAYAHLSVEETAEMVRQLIGSHVEEHVCATETTVAGGKARRAGNRGLTAGS